MEMVTFYPLGPVEVRSVAELVDLFKNYPRTPVVVYFHAAWCAPCKTYGPVVERAAELFGDRAVFAKVDVEAVPDVANQLRVKGVPTTTILVDGVEAWRASGALPLNQLVEAVKEVLRRLGA
ncbi:MAG: hypothetical protein Kow0069_08840 [Promethearchaeota archaeon]